MRSLSGVDALIDLPTSAQGTPELNRLNLRNLVERYALTPVGTPTDLTPLLISGRMRNALFPLSRTVCIQSVVVRIDEEECAFTYTDIPSHNES